MVPTTFLAELFCFVLSFFLVLATFLAFLCLFCGIIHGFSMLF